MVEAQRKIKGHAWGSSEPRWRWADIHFFGSEMTLSLESGLKGAQSPGEGWLVLDYLRAIHQCNKTGQNIPQREGVGEEKEKTLIAKKY